MSKKLKPTKPKTIKGAYSDQSQAHEWSQKVTSQPVAFPPSPVKKEPPLLKPDVATDFTLNIPDMIYQELMCWVNMSQDEVSWFGSLKWDQKTKTFEVQNIRLLKQENDRTETTLEASDLAWVLHELKDDDYVHWWGHSHVKMDVSWSAQDMHTMRDIGRQGFVLATVFNQFEEMRTAYLQQVEVMGNKHDLFIDDIKTNVVRYLPATEVSRWEADFREKVTSLSEKRAKQWKQWRFPGPWDDDYGNVVDYSNNPGAYQPPPGECQDWYFEDTLYAKFATVEAFWDALEEIDLITGVSYYTTYMLPPTAGEEQFIEAMRADHKWHFERQPYLGGDDNGDK